MTTVAIPRLGEMAEEQQLTALLIGRSGSGKSVLAQKLFSNLTRPCYILNDKTGKTPFKRVEWSQVFELKKCALLIEDLICLNKSQLATVKTILNWSNHHAQVSSFRLCFIIFLSFFFFPG